MRMQDEYGNDIPQTPEQEPVESPQEESLEHIKEMYDAMTPEEKAYLKTLCNQEMTEPSEVMESAMQEEED